MKKIAFAAFCMIGLAACDPAVLLRQVDDVDDPEISCFTRPQGGCNFDRNPLRVLPEPVVIPRRPYQFFPTAEPLTFVDSQGKRWIAPSRTLTDGASIPRIFTSIVGDPTSPEFRNAAAVHDAYCGIGNELGANYQIDTWQEVHRMFYDGLIVGGTDEITAKLMFAAVWLGGPRWNTHRDLDHVPDVRKQRAMRQAKAYVEAKRPALPKLEAYLWWLEKQMLDDYPRIEREDKERSSEKIVEEEPSYPEYPEYPEYPDYPNDPVDPEDPTGGGVLGSAGGGDTVGSDSPTGSLPDSVKLRLLRLQ